ncbi:MAG: 3-methyl-2-oxobutanoate hydroxymethyltransferase [candidate division Zixibacteria bacterium]|nr:3-methyl-2-oxobutanoate hydroxymethyltransferase [candidate division Zixibacteria bacterium]
MSSHPAPAVNHDRPNDEAKSPGRRPVTVTGLLEMKRAGQKIAMLTAYDYYTARMLDECGIDGILVGDSANMVFYGEPNTLSITVDQMIYHTRAVARAVRSALVIADMPFMSYQVNADDALRNAGRFLKEAGATAVKVEGGLNMVPTVKRLIEAGIPVMSHIGLVPQSIHRLGGYGVRGRDDKERAYLVESAQALAEAGSFAIVLEAIRGELAREITQSIPIPTIGIGAGAECDGQILVSNDMLGSFEDFQPKFVRRYANVAEVMRRAFGQYRDDVRNGEFPSDKEGY